MTVSLAVSAESTSAHLLSPDTIRTTLPASPDMALVSAAVEGSEAAFRELFRRHTPHLLQFVTRVLGANASEAEDVVQDAWLRAYPALVTFRNESSFSTWLCSVGLRAALDSLRKGKRRSTEFILEDEDAPLELPHHEDRMDLETAIASLAPGYRMILVLHDVEGFTHEEIALQLGIAPGTSKAQLFKARRVMRALLTGREKNDVQ